MFAPALIKISIVSKRCNFTAAINADGHDGQRAFKFAPYLRSSSSMAGCWCVEATCTTFEQPLLTKASSFGNDPRSRNLETNSRLPTLTEA
jgi:hypothetical protein